MPLPWIVTKASYRDLSLDNYGVSAQWVPSSIGQLLPASAPLSKPSAKTSTQTCGDQYHQYGLMIWPDAKAVRPYICIKCVTLTLVQILQTLCIGSLTA